MKRITSLIAIALAACTLTAQAQSDFKQKALANRNISYHVALDFQYEDFESGFSEGVARVKIAGEPTFCYIDTTGKPIMAARFRTGKPFSHGCALVENDGKWGFVDKRGGIVAPLKYAEAASYSEGYALVAVDINNHNRLYGFIDTLGKEMYGVPPRFEWALSFDGKWAPVKYNGKLKYISNNLSGTLENLPYDHIGPFHEGFARVEKGGKYGFINGKGNLVIPMMPYEEVDMNFHDGRCRVKQNGKYGYIDTTGRLVIICKFTYAMPFSCERAVVSEAAPSKWSNMVDENFGAIDLHGKYAVQPVYESLGTFSEGFAVVFDKTTRQYGYVDVNGKVVIPWMYEAARAVTEGYAPVKVNGKWGFLKLDLK